MHRKLSETHVSRPAAALEITAASSSALLRKKPRPRRRTSFPLPTGSSRRELPPTPDPWSTSVIVTAMVETSSAATSSGGAHAADEKKNSRGPASRTSVFKGVTRHRRSGRCVFFVFVGASLERARGEGFLRARRRRKEIMRAREERERWADDDENKDIRHCQPPKGAVATPSHFRVACRSRSTT